ncbi:hypothetical protein Z946_1807 [Sulfitobacter noctilucicola]|nr:hypothetical protein Z946_1807 [Sulfitobacter noctilucicola]
MCKIIVRDGEPDHQSDSWIYDKSKKEGPNMSTDLFLGGLASLILAAIVIAVLTTNKRE